MIGYRGSNSLNISKPTQRVLIIFIPVCFKQKGDKESVEDTLGFISETNEKIK